MAVNNTNIKHRDRAFWKMVGSGVSFVAGLKALDGATIISAFVFQLTGSSFAVGATATIQQLGRLIPQIFVGYLAQRSTHRMPFFIFGATGRILCIGVLALMLAAADLFPPPFPIGLFFVLWAGYAFLGGIDAVPYHDIVGRTIPSHQRSRLIAWCFLGGGILGLGVAAAATWLLAALDFYAGHAAVFGIATIMLILSGLTFLWVGEHPAPATAAKPSTFAIYLREGLDVFTGDKRFRWFLYAQWLGGVAMMALPFYVVAAWNHGFAEANVGLLLGAQTLGILLSNMIWGYVGDHFGKQRLLEWVGVLRLLPPLSVIGIIMWMPHNTFASLCAFLGLYFLIGVVTNGTGIGFLGYLMEISPNDRRPAYSAYFNTMAAPAGLLPLAGAALIDIFSLQVLFAATCGAAIVQLIYVYKLRSVTTAHAS